jgi:hypothetical protein
MSAQPNSVEMTFRNRLSKSVSQFLFYTQMSAKYRANNMKFVASLMTAHSHWTQAEQEAQALLTLFPNAEV